MWKTPYIGQNLIPAVKEIMSIMFSNAVDIISNIPLSNNSVSRRIDEISDEITDTLVAELKSTKFAMQVDVRHYFFDISVM